MSIDSISTGAGQTMQWQPGLGRMAEADTEGRGLGNSGRSEGANGTSKSDLGVGKISKGM